MASGTPYVEVIPPEGETRLFDLLSDRVILGSGLTCQVVVEAPGIVREHMLLVPRPDGCYVALALGVTTPVVYQGTPLERGLIPWGGEIAVAGVRIVLHDGSVPRALRAAAAAARRGGAAGAAGPGSGATVSPVVILAAVVMLPLAAWMMLMPHGDEVPRATVAAPPLFDSLERRCPQADPAAAAALANDLARRAVAKAERMPFRAQDGIEAVELHAQAAACYAATGDGAKSAFEGASARALAAQIEDEFRNHRFRLDRALEQHRLEDALMEVRLLKSLAAHTHGPYHAWLDVMDRRLALQIDQSAGGGAR